MPGRDEQSALDERTDSYLAAKTSLNPSQGFRGILFIRFSLKDSQVPHFPPSLTNTPSGFIYLKIAQEETTLLLFYTQTKWSGNCTRKPIHLLSFSSAVDGIYYTVHPAPCLCQAACGVKYGWGRRPRSQRGGDCLCSSISRSSKPIYYRARGAVMEPKRRGGKVSLLNWEYPYLSQATDHTISCFTSIRGQDQGQTLRGLHPTSWGRKKIFWGEALFLKGLEAHQWPVFMCQ